METTDAFRARFEENYTNLLIKKGMDPAAARTRAREKAAALPERIETPGAGATARPRLHVPVGPPRPVFRARPHLRLLCWPVWKSRYRRDVVPAAARWREVDDFHPGTGNFAACRATAHNCNCTTMISLLSSRTIPCRTVWEDAVTGTRSRRWRGASEILFPHRCRAHVHRCRCDNPSHKCLSRVHKCICGTVLGKCLKHPSRKK